MDRNAYYRSKMPLPLVLLFLANIFVVVAFELMLSYTLPAKADEVFWRSYDPAWSDSTIVSQDIYSIDLNAYILELSDGSHQLLTTKCHRIFFGRAKLLSTQEVDLGTAQKQTFQIKNGIHTAEVTVTANGIVNISYGYGGGMKEVLSLYMVLGTAMEAAELMVYYLIKKNLS